MCKRYRMMIGFSDVRQNGRFFVSSHRRSFRYSLKQGITDKKDYYYYYKFFKGKGF